MFMFFGNICLIQSFLVLPSLLKNESSFMYRLPKNNQIDRFCSHFTGRDRAPKSFH